MASVQSQVKKVKKFLKGNKNGRWVALILIILGLILLIRGCSTQTQMSNTYRIGVNVYWQQLNLMGKERIISAFSGDLLIAIAAEEKTRFEVQQLESSSVLAERLYNVEDDGILTSLNPTVLNKTTLVFSDVYLPLGSVLIIRSGAPMKGWNEQSRKIVGVQTNSSSILELEKNPSIQIKLYDDILKALADLDNQTIDGVIFPAIPAYTYVNTFYAGKMKIATTPLTDEGLRLVALNNERGKELVALFNQGLATLKKNGTYEKLLTRWGLINVNKIIEVKEPPAPDVSWLNPKEMESPLLLK